MAVGDVRSGNILALNGSVSYPTSAGSTWVTVNDDARTAQSAGDLLEPASIDDSVFHWCKRNNATRVIVRALDPAGTLTTSPVVRLILGWGTLDGSSPATTAKFMRGDNADSNATGFTLTLVSLATGQIADADGNIHSDPSTLEGYDLLGCDFFGIAVETAAAFSAGAAAVPIECLLLN